MARSPRGTAVEPSARLRLDLRGRSVMGTKVESIHFLSPPYLTSIDSAGEPCTMDISSITAYAPRARAASGLARVTRLDVFLLSVPREQQTKVPVFLTAYSPSVSWCVSPVTLPADSLVHGRPWHRSPQSSQTTHACDQHQRGGQTQEKRIQRRHRVDLLHPLVEGTRCHKTDTVRGGQSPCGPCAPYCPCARQGSWTATSRVRTIITSCLLVLSRSVLCEGYPHAGLCASHCTWRSRGPGSGHGSEKMCRPGCPAEPACLAERLAPRGRWAYHKFPLACSCAGLDYRVGHI
jgi:hypothetical protein